MLRFVPVAASRSALGEKATRAIGPLVWSVAVRRRVAGSRNSTVPFTPPTASVLSSGDKARHQRVKSSF